MVSSHKPFFAFDEPLLAQILDILPSYPESYLTTFGNDLTRHGCCRLISSLVQGRFPLTDLHVKNFVSIIQATLERREEWVVEYAVDAVRGLSRHPESHACISVMRETVDPWLNCLRIEKDKFVRRGYALAVGMLSVNILGNRLEKALRLLCEGALMTVRPLYFLHCRATHHLCLCVCVGGQGDE